MPLSRVFPVLLLSIATLAFAGPAFAQAASTQRPLQQEMSPEEFKATGLDKLSAEELARLNAWLDRKIDTETTRAAEQAQDKLKTETRGFFSVGSAEPIVSTLVGEFRGFQKGRNYILANGQEWEQIEEASLVGVRKTNPGVKITPSKVGNAWYLAIDGYNTRAKVRRIK
jgi:hypothetical protein